MKRADDVEHLFKSVDVDNSGDVDLGEYISWVNENVGHEHAVSPSLYLSYIDHFYS